MSRSNIPQELRELHQWVCAGTDKHPINPRTAQPASVTDRSTWGTFEQACSAGYQHIGFVLSPEDPYTIVDLDDPKTKRVKGQIVVNNDAAEVARIETGHRQIMEMFPSYSEISQSGNGVHIVVRGRIPRGIRSGKIEMYSESRYMIFTGNILKNLAIADCTKELDTLFGWLNQYSTPEPVELSKTLSTIGDEALYDMGVNAVNGDKFLQLWRGKWEGDYPSQSEADYALLSMLAFYSPDNEQVRRMFRWCALGQRMKARKNDYYLDTALSKIRGKEPPRIDLSNLKKNEEDSLFPQPQASGERQIIETGTIASNQTNPRLGTPWPAGFVGDLAAYFYASAIRPVPEIALASAIALTAGVVGRAFNIKGTGLNQYILVLAATGSGKEGGATGIDQMIASVRPTIPMIDEFIGPGHFASGQALIRTLDKNPCFVSVLGEFGLTLQQLCHPGANSAQVMLKKVLLDIFAKSGWQKVLASSVYSDSEKNTKRIQAPNVTIFGESNPEKFYEGLDASIISEGLLPRFFVFEYTGPRPPSNENAFFPPNETLVRAFASLATVAMQAQANRACSPVQLDNDSDKLLKAFDKYADSEINGHSNDVVKQLWNRAHLKALKIAALIAVGINPHQPIIRADTAQWAINLVIDDVKRILAKFEDGETGSGDARLEAEIRRACSAWFKMTQSAKAAYQCPQKLLKLELVPLNYLRRRLRGRTCVSTDRRGSNRALRETLEAMGESGVLGQLSPSQGRELDCTSPVYGKGANW